jgi:hypothetical protein
MLDNDARAVAFEAAMANRDTEGLRGFLHDPVQALRVMAAEALDDEVGRGLLEEQARIEMKQGIAAGAPCDTPASFALHRLQVKSQRSQPLLLIPAEGGSHPAFRHLERQEVLVIWATFPAEPNEAERTWFADTVEGAAQRLAATEPKANIQDCHNGQTFELMVAQLEDPAAVASAFCDALSGPDSHLRELLIGKFYVPTEDAPLWHAVEDPRYRGETVRWDEWWERSFNLDMNPPDAEPEGGPSLLLIPSSQGKISEVRLMRPYFEDVRVCYGLAKLDARQPQGRDAEVSAALKVAFDRAFRGVPPEYFCRSGERNGPIDSIVCQGRNGYAFALSGLVPQFIVHYPSCFRCREFELFAAMREVILSLGLAPVIHWARDAGTWIVNLWER